MAEDQDIRAARIAIGRVLATHVIVERDLPERLQALLNELKRRDEQSTRADRDN